MKHVYMDHSATTAMDTEVLQAMLPYFQDKYGNPSSIHSYGQEARVAVEEARTQVASLINASANEIIFTSGGTEADNQAIISYMTNSPKKGSHLICSAIEHHAVLDACEYLAKQGFELTILPVNEYGIVEPEVLRDAMQENTALVSIMHANNEIGTIQPIEELAAIAHEKGAIFHSDAVQTVGRIQVDVKDLDIDMLSVSAHKFYGPKGIGCLYVKKGVRVGKHIFGGSQERKLRAGTENVPAIIGFGKACELAGARMNEVESKLLKLGTYLREGILNQIPHTLLTGHPEKRLPGSVSVCFEFVEGESILLMLDSVGIMGSSGSACTAGSLEPSHILLALGLPHEIAHGSLRLTLGKDNTKEEVDYVLEKLPPIIQRLRDMSPLYKN